MNFPERTQTAEFILRCYGPGDGAALSEAVNSSYEHLAPWMPWAKPQQGVAESEALVRSFRANWLLRSNFVVAVFDAHDTRVLGGSGFHLRDGPLEFEQAEVGMWVRADGASAGLGTAILAEMLRWGFEDWGWHRLSWHCDPSNGASARVAEKNGLALEGRLRQNGFTPDGARRDTLIYATLASDWRSRRAMPSTRR